ncbi:MAG: hypothetical protein WD534_02925 [Phycisphaeraceae bacterium]
MAPVNPGWADDAGVVNVSSGANVKLVMSGVFFRLPQAVAGSRRRFLAVGAGAEDNVF